MPQGFSQKIIYDFETSACVHKLMQVQQQNFENYGLVIFLMSMSIQNRHAQVAILLGVLTAMKTLVATLLFYLLYNLKLLGLLIQNQRQFSFVVLLFYGHLISRLRIAPFSSTLIRFGPIEINYIFWHIGSNNTRNNEQILG